MKKLLIVLFATLISCSTFSQKIKIEKKTGLMSIDNINVATFLSSKNANKQEVYTFTDLHSDDFVALTMVKLGKDEENFLQVNSSLSDKTSEMDYEVINFTLNMGSAISNLIVKKYNFFTTEGMNRDAIVQFLDLENNKYKLAHESNLKEQQAVQEMIGVFAPFVKNALTVINKNTKEEILLLKDPSGRFDRYRDSSTDYDNFIVTDGKGNKLATVRKGKSSTLFPDYFIETYDNVTYSIGKVTQSDIPMEVTKKLIVHGYLGDGEKSPVHRRQLQEMALTVRAADAQAQAEEYNRRVHVEGILTLEDGRELEGQFKADFRETADGMVSQSGNIVSLDGKTLTYYYKNEKGKDKLKVYKEKEIRSFRVTKEDDSSYDEYYCKIEYINPQGKADVITGDGLDVMGLGKNLLGGNKPKTKKSLVYRAVDTPKTALFFSGNKIFITDKKTEKTVLLDKNRYEDQLKEIAGNCSAVLENIENHKYKMERNSIYNFTEDCNECK